MVSFLPLVMRLIFTAHESLFWFRTGFVWKNFPVAPALFVTALMWWKAVIYFSSWGMATNIVFPWTCLCFIMCPTVPAFIVRETPIWLVAWHSTCSWFWCDLIRWCIFTAHKSFLRFWTCLIFHNRPVAPALLVTALVWRMTVVHFAWRWPATHISFTYTFLIELVCPSITAFVVRKTPTWCITWFFCRNGRRWFCRFSYWFCLALVTGFLTFCIHKVGIFVAFT